MFSLAAVLVVLVATEVFNDLSECHVRCFNARATVTTYATFVGILCSAVVAVC